MSTLTIILLSLLLVYIISTYIIIDFIRKSFKPGGINEGVEFENIVYFFTFMPLLNIVIACICLINTPYQHQPGTIRRINNFLRRKIFKYDNERVSGNITDSENQILRFNSFIINQQKENDSNQ